MNVQDVRKELAASVVLLLVGVWFGYFLANRTIRTNAIQQECAHYDPKSGEFTWGVMQ
jgi:hypothetical protein